MVMGLVRQMWGRGPLAEGLWDERCLAAAWAAGSQLDEAREEIVGAGFAAGRLIAGHCLAGLLAEGCFEGNPNELPLGCGSGGE